jgi:hypothetical protein
VPAALAQLVTAFGVREVIHLASARYAGPHEWRQPARDLEAGMFQSEMDLIEVEVHQHARRIAERSIRRSRWRRPRDCVLN